MRMVRLEEERATSGRPATSTAAATGRALSQREGQ